MVVFSLFALVELMLGAFVGGLVAGILWLVGVSPDTIENVFVLVMLLVAAPIDLLWRLAGAGHDDEEGVEAPPFRPMQMVQPGMGGHIMFLPVWTLPLVAGVLVFGLGLGG